MRTLRTRLRWAASVLAGREQPLPEPWDYVQSLVERRLHDYLGIAAGEVQLVVIVGAWRGHEVARLLPRYRNARIVCFEPLEDAYRALCSRYGQNGRVEVTMAAASDTHDARAQLHVPDRGGTASLLVPSDAAARVERVATVRLDVALKDEPRIDCLWIDVQGAERLVLAGAAGILDRVRSVFVEVATRSSAYEGGTLMPEIAATLERSGFVLQGLGIDPRNGTGNALWVRPSARP